MQNPVQPLQYQVMPLSLFEMPWLASNHSQGEKKTSLHYHIRKVSPQGNPWVHKEGIYIENVWAKTGAGSWWQCRRRSRLYYSHPTGLHQLKDDNSCKQMGISNTNVFSKTGNSSNSCAEMAVSQCTKKHRKYVVLHGLSYTCSSQTARHNFLPSNCLPSSTDTELMSEWLSTSPCYSMPWIRLPKLQRQAKHLQLISFAWNGIRREKRNWGCSRNHFVYIRESFSNSVGNSGRKSLLPML